MSDKTITLKLGKRLDCIWFTRSPVPTAAGLAHQLGWLTEAFNHDGIAVETFEETPRVLAQPHHGHDLFALFREGGNVPALAARAQGAPSRLVGLTWIDEWQVILTRPDAGITEPAQLRDVRIALPAFAETRGGSVARAMTLHGVKGALSLAGLTFDDVRFVEVPLLQTPEDATPEERLQNLWAGLPCLMAGRVDAVYVKGASAVEAVQRIGAVVGVDLDRFPDKRTRVNNGTPRPVTVHQHLLDEHFDLVVRFLEQTLRAADWAASNLMTVRHIMERETHAGAKSVAIAYGSDFHRTLHPDLSQERIDLLKQQKDFLLLHGFLDRDVNIENWIDTRPLQAALALRARAAERVERAVA